LFLCGRIVHSYIFQIEVNETGGLHGIFFTSDNDKDKKIYAVDIDSVVSIYKAVGNDYPTSMHWSKNIETGKEQYKIQ